MAYRETWKKIIKPNPLTESGRHKVLLPILVYLDGCVTGQYMNLSLEILKICLGIFKVKYRDTDNAWHPLGYVAHYETSKSRGKDIIRESNHVDAKNYLRENGALTEDDLLNPGKNTPDFDPSGYVDLQDPESRKKPDVPELAAQDLHKMLHAILSTYKEIQDD